MSAVLTIALPPAAHIRSIPHPGQKPHENWQLVAQALEHHLSTFNHISPPRTHLQPPLLNPVRHGPEYHIACISSVPLIRLLLDFLERAGTAVDLEEGLEFAGAGIIGEIGDLQAQGREDEMLVEGEGAVVLRICVDLGRPGVIDVVVDDTVVAGVFGDVDFDDQVGFFGAVPVAEEGLDFLLVEFGGVHFPGVSGVGLGNGHTDTGVGDDGFPKGERRLNGLGDAEGFAERVVVIVELKGGLGVGSVVACDGHSVLGK